MAPFPAHRSAGRRRSRRARSDDFLAVHPEDRIAAAGRLKVLKGRHAGLLQYDLPSFYRLWYRVDRERRIVIVEYVAGESESSGL